MFPAPPTPPEGFIEGTTPLNPTLSEELLISMVGYELGTILIKNKSLYDAVTYFVWGYAKSDGVLKIPIAGASIEPENTGVIMLWPTNWYTYGHRKISIQLRSDSEAGRACEYLIEYRKVPAGG